MADEEITLTSLPTPSHLTLLFKNQRSTTLLSVLPSTPFSQITSLLHAALASRNYHSLPTDPSDLELGVLVDRKDPSKGWVSLDTKIRQEEKGKGKADSKKGRPSGGVVGSQKDTPDGIGLGDGGWVAWRVRGSTKAEEDDEDEVEDLLSGDMDDRGWDVVLPSLEEAEEGMEGEA